MKTHIYRRKFSVVVALLMLLGWAFTAARPAAAQENLVIVDELGSLDQAAIESAAQPILDRGARVAVFLISTGGQSDVLPQLQRVGLAQGTQVHNDLIAVYVSLEPRYSEIRYGDNWIGNLDGEAGNIRENTLNPHLRERQFTAAFTDTFSDVDAVLGNALGYKISKLFSGDNMAIWIVIIMVLFFGWAFWVGIKGSGASGGAYTSSGYDSSWDSSSSYDSGSSSDFGSGGSDGGDW